MDLQTIYRLIEIIPTVEYLASKPHVPQRCTRGHTWDVGFELVGVHLDLSAFGLTDGPEVYCAAVLVSAQKWVPRPMPQYDAKEWFWTELIDELTAALDRARRPT